MKQTYFQLLTALGEYTPKNAHFTSQEEVDALNAHFGLESMTRYDLQNLRDFVVMYYDAKMDDSPRNERFYALSAAMMSITAVIDSFIYRA